MKSLRSTLLAIVIGACALVSTSKAGAQEPFASTNPDDAKAWAAVTAKPVDPPVPMETRWYGWQTLSVDALGVLGSLAVQNVAVFVGVYAIGGPIVHATLPCAVGKAFASFGVRAGTAAVGVLIGAEAAKGNSSNDATAVLGGMVIGGGIGCLFGMAIDSALLARDEVPRRGPTTARITPTASVDTRGASAGLAGTF